MEVSGAVDLLTVPELAEQPAVAVADETPLIVWSSYAWSTFWPRPD